MACVDQFHRLGGGRLAVRRVDDLEASMSRPCSRATRGDLRGGPDQNRNDDARLRRFDAPRSEVSSQGCATTVVAGGTCLARAMSRSYLRCGGCPIGPTAVMVPISLSST